ncbi:GIY-YIG nuclease family protein [Chloroflexota bacterium]
MIKGSYILVLGLLEGQDITVGSLGSINFSGGYYAYVGSALGGLETRLNRHLRRDKKLHWHIDYLLKKATINNIITCRTGERIECDITQTLGRRFESVLGFGSSDCKCRSHLFFSTGEMEQEILEELYSLGVETGLKKVATEEDSVVIRSGDYITDGPGREGYVFFC